MLPTCAHSYISVQGNRSSLPRVIYQCYYYTLPHTQKFYNLGTYTLNKDMGGVCLAEAITHKYRFLEVVYDRANQFYIELVKILNQFQMHTYTHIHI